MLDSTNIDVTFSFTNDTPGYWDNFWESQPLLGHSSKDPDKMSPTLRAYHQFLWSKPLPNGEIMQLEHKRSGYYLEWKDFCFGSDSIIVSFRYTRRTEFMKKLRQHLGDEYRHFIESYVTRASVIGGYMIFPSFNGGINQSRGTNYRICDRWDLTLECIRLYYEGKRSPIYDALNKSKPFFDLFVDFRGFVDFFFLQDCVTPDYSKVILWYDSPLTDTQLSLGNEWQSGKEEFDTNFFVMNPMPNTIEEYFAFVDNEFHFLDKRNKRITGYCNNC